MASDEDVQPILDYTARDFDATRSLLVGLARGLFPEWKTVGEANDFGTLLLELYAYMADINNYYIDRVGSEAFLGTAQRRQSVLYMAEMLGYNPIGQHAAITELKFTLSADSTEDLEIPAGTKVSTTIDTNPTTVVFETDYTVTVSPNSSVTVSATEGQSVTQYLGSSKGSPNMEFPLPDLGVISGSLRVRTKEGSYLVDNSNEDTPHYVTWNEINSVAAARPNQSVFSTYVDDKNVTHILFGDGASGRIPPIGADIEVSYRYGVGVSANQLNENSLVSIVDPNLPVDKLTVTNTAVPVGGSDVESTSSMRNNIPKGAQVRGRAVTLDDYVSLALQVPGVAKAVAYGQVYSAVNVRIAPVGGVLDPNLTDAIRLSVQTYLSDKVLIGSKVFVEDAQWTDIYINMDLFVLDGFDREQTKNDVLLALQNLLAFDNVDMGQDITVGSVYRRAMRVEGVDYIDLKGLNTVGVDSTVIENIVVPFGHIARIHPAGVDPETDPYGVKITATGGIESDA